MVKFFKRMADQAFASAMGFLLAAGGIVTLTHTGLTTDALAQLVPGWLLTVLAVTYGISGVFLLLGVGSDRFNVEAAGCVLAFSGLTIRALALLYVIGFTVPAITTVGFYIAFAWAFAERFRQILNGERVIRIPSVVGVVKGDDDDGGNDTD